MSDFKFSHNRITYTIISAIFVFIHYGLGFMVNYQPDIYSTISTPEALAKGYIYPGGRIVLALIAWIMRRPGQPYYVYYYISFVLSLFLLVVTNVVFSELIGHRLSKNSGVSITAGWTTFIGLVSCLTITNIFSAEFALYSDSYLGFVLDIFLCIIASKAFLKIVDNESTFKDNLLIVVCLLLAVFIYEPIISVFVIVSTLFSLVYSKNIGSFVKAQAKCALLYGTAMGVKLIYTKFVIDSPRARFDVAPFAEKSKDIVIPGKLPETFILDRITFGMWIYAGVSILVFGVIVYRAVKTRQFIHLIKISYLSVVTVIMGSLPFILRLSNDYKPRIYYPLAYYFGALVIYGILSGLIGVNKERCNALLISFLVILSGIQWLSFVQMFVDQYITNYEDKYISEIIGECIDEYEQTTSEDVKYITFYSDGVRTKYSRNNGWCITERAYDATWSKLPTLNFYLGRDYKEGDVDKEIAERFSNSNWDVFSKEQIIFTGETAHVCTY